ncbi:MAG TPA: ubiquinol-cytochrome c reductase iron-sulfur subunit [Gammaproteobacteria bacterium]|nr:ubiquinol-cytochrome c reductase iron-sulfur subunit [Gammaproteobacteria bacterium]
MVEVNFRRRRFLTRLTAGVGAVGAGFAVVPFVSSMLPSARALAAGSPTTVDFSKLESGQMITVGWRGKPIWIVYRTKEMLDRLWKIHDFLLDPESSRTSQQPDYAKNEYRSRGKRYSVLVGICTHLGCVPLSKFTPGVNSGVQSDWPGGYYCPCHGSKYDLAGRVFKNVPAPSNLLVPPHYFVNETTVIIGLNSKEEVAG